MMFFMVTKGPVFRIRFEAAPFTGDFIDDRWVQGAFVVGALVVIALCLPAITTLRIDPLVLVTLAAVVGLITVSGLWSVDSARTVEQGAMMAVGTVAALLAGASLSRLGLVTALAVAMHAGVVASLFSYWRDWPLAIDHNGDLAGVYFNRNSLGPVAVLAAATAVALAVHTARARRWGVVVLLGLVAVIDLWVWWLSGSLTPVFGLVVALTAVGLLALTLPGPRARMRRRIAVVAGSGVTLVVVVGVISSGAIASRLDRSPTLSGRTEIWDVVLQFVGERPIQGWGFMAVWTRPEIIDALAEQYGREVYEAHSGFMEVLLGVGIIGLVALVVAVGVMLGRVGTVTWRTPDALGVFLFGAAVYAVAVNLGETMVGANLLPWILLTAITGRALAELQRDPS
ncbi:MAG: hypothetical protein EA389_14355 [Ilumatobacter sp.]|nr:MAG: hypothetical protein EA389_14355 [Ilumatobacter sp.]